MKVENTMALGQDKENSMIITMRGPQGPRQRLARVDFSSKAYMLTCAVIAYLFILGGIACFHINELRTGATLCIASAALIGYGFNSFIQHRIRIGDKTDDLLSLLRGRWDELRKDPVLLPMLTDDASATPFNDTNRARLRYYLYTLFDVYEYALHLITSGYFPNEVEVAIVYEAMIKKTLELPRVKEIWEERGPGGRHLFQNEYSPYIIAVVNNLLAEIDMNSGHSHSDSTADFH